MLFETSQVLDLVGIGKDTLRTWKKHLVPIAAIDGRVGKYTFGQMLALFVIARASQDIGVPISRFKEFSDMIFEEMERQVVPEADRRVLVVVKGDIFFVEENALAFDTPAAAIVSVRSARSAIVNGLDAVASPRLESQLELPLDGGGS